MMTVYIKPSTARGEITAPPSKSAAHRALICAALSPGSTVNNVAMSDDIKATLGGLESLGAHAVFIGNTVTIGGIEIGNIPGARINAAESGSTLRFLIPLALLSGKKTVFSGSGRLFDRDLSVYAEIANSQGILFSESGNSLVVCGKLKSGEYRVRGDISSQFVSGLIFALPCLAGDSYIEFTTQIESKPYIDMTVAALSRFGVCVTQRENGYFIEGGQSYKNGCVTVEGDWSNAAFLDAFNLIGGDVKVRGLSADTLQGDKIYKEYFARIKEGGSFDIGNCPDLAPVLFALAAEFSGAVFSGTRRLRIKESDRALAMKTELAKFGGELIIGDNEVTVRNKKLHTPTSSLDSHNDHRIVMALSILASRYGGCITGAESVNKSYPGFFGDIKKLGIEVDAK